MKDEGIGGSWIVKLPSMKYEGVLENEFAMMELARKVGIDIPEVRFASSFTKRKSRSFTAFCETGIQNIKKAVFQIRSWTFDVRRSWV